MSRDREERREEPAEREPLKPLTTWEKIKIGAKGFGKSVMEYLPKGLLFSGMAMAGSAALGAISGNPSWDIFHVVSNPGMIPVRMGLSLGIGGLISGGVGAWEAVKTANREREDAMIVEGEQLRRERARGPERQRDTGFSMSGMPPTQAGLPRATPVNQPAPGFR